MTKTIVITHGSLAKELVDITDQILEKETGAVAICFDLVDEYTELKNKIEQALATFDESDKVIILTDLFGGTASNAAIPFAQKERVEVITGLNLAMLLYLFSQPENKTFINLCQGVKTAGKDAIIVAGEFLP
jgi:mannose PTS system EIIA component